MEKGLPRPGSRNELVMSRIREICALLGIRQRDLADSLRMNPSQMNLYFQGKVEMRAERFVALLGLLGIDLEKALENRLRELGEKKRRFAAGGTENKMLTTLGRLDEYQQQSLLRIIGLLGSK